MEKRHFSCYNMDGKISDKYFRRIHMEENMNNNEVMEYGADQIQILEGLEAVRKRAASSCI